MLLSLNSFRLVFISSGELSDSAGGSAPSSVEVIAASHQQWQPRVSAVGTLFSLFVVSVMYSLIAKEFDRETEENRVAITQA